MLKFMYLLIFNKFLLIFVKYFFKLVNHGIKNRDDNDVKNTLFYIMGSIYRALY